MPFWCTLRCALEPFVTVMRDKNHKVFRLTGTRWRLFKGELPASRFVTSVTPICNRMSSDGIFRRDGTPLLDRRAAAVLGENQQTLSEDVQLSGRENKMSGIHEHAAWDFLGAGEMLLMGRWNGVTRGKHFSVTQTTKGWWVDERREESGTEAGRDRLDRRWSRTKFLIHPILKKQTKKIQKIPRKNPTKFLRVSYRTNIWTQQQAGKEWWWEWWWGAAFTHSH